MEIKLEHLEYCYDKKKEKVLDGVDITFKEGKITGLVGSNGFGKSTLLNLLSGRILPTNGTIKMDNITISKTGIKGDIFSFIGYVPQFLENDFICDTVEKELFFLLEKHHYNPQKRKKHIKEALELVGLNDTYLERDPLSLSNGELRKLSLACALSFNPKILLLDEPFVGLDSKDRQMLITVLTTIKRRYQKTILIASNNIDMIHKVADDMIVLKEGKILISGSKREVLNYENLPIELPKITQFENYVLKVKNIRLEKRTEINDLVKDILRNLK